MELRIHRNQLLQAATRIQGAISDRNFSQAGIRAKDGSVVVSLTDRLLAIYSQHECEVAVEGHVFIPAKLLVDMVRELAPGYVTLAQRGPVLEVIAGERDEFFMRIPTVEQPWKELVLNKNLVSADLRADALQYMIKQVDFCIAHESTRNYASVAFLHRVDEQKLRLVGSDGYRLSYADISVQLPEDFLTQGVCLSKRALQELERVSREGFENVRISFLDDQTTILAEVPNYQIYIRLSSVKYPKYQGVLPKGNLIPVDVSRPLLQTVAKRVLLAADRTYALQLCFGNSSLTLSSKTVGSSEGKESIVLQGYSGGDQELSVNGRFLADVFATIPSPEVTLKFRGKEDPIVLIPKVEPLGCASMHVLVPIHESEQTV